MAPDRITRLAVPAAAALLLWPALWNGYPIVFADTGTYLSQAIRLYAGWDRPVFYSLFMLPLHWRITIWPVVVAQALLTAWVLRLVCHALIPGMSAAAFIAGIAVLSACTWLPWLVCELMPDLFTPLLVLALCLLALAPDRLSPIERLCLAALATLMIATQQSSLPLTAGVLAVLAGFSWLTRQTASPRHCASWPDPVVLWPNPVVSPSGPMASRPGRVVSWPGLARPSMTSPIPTGQQEPDPPPLAVTAGHTFSVMAGPAPMGIRTSGGRRIVWPIHRGISSWFGLSGPPLPVRAATGSPDTPNHDDESVPAGQIVLPATPILKPMGPSPAIRASSANATMAVTHPAMTDKPLPNRPAPPRRWRLLAFPPLIALLALCTVNLAAHGRFAVSPFGNIFLLARVLYDGPGMAALRRDCPTTHWRLCPFLADFPTNSDDFLWTHDSPLNRAGGPKLVSTEADAIIGAAIRTDPIGELHAAFTNTLTQLTMFASGDGLNPWPAEVSPWIERYFPVREQAAFAAARQQQGTLAMPPLLARVHQILALAGVLACALLLPGAVRRRAPCADFLLAVLLVLPLSAAITGGLSAPHDRYQARIMWLPPFMAAAAFAARRRRQP